MFKITWKNIIFLVLVSIPNTLLTFGILFIVNQYISGEKVEFAINLEWYFFLIVLFSFIINYFLQRKIISYTYNSIYRSELKIFKALQQTSLRQFEEIGENRIYGVIEDVRTFVFFPGILSATASALMTLIICIAYCFVLSVSATIVIISSILIMTIFYSLMNRKLVGKVRFLRRLNDVYFEVVNDTLRGFKELKMSSIRTRNLFEKFINSNRLKARDTETKVSNSYLVVNLLSQYGIYLLLGLILFVLPLLNLLDRNQIVTFVVILLFISGPIISLISMQNQYTKYYVANKRINLFLHDLKLNVLPKSDGMEKPILNNIDKIEFKEVEFNYDSTSKDESFLLGPINLTIKMGETLFVVGGNGSGKSTFISCLTGLNTPTSGDIIVNDRMVIIEPEWYRDFITPIFTDNHLFSRNYENYSLNNNEKYMELLRLMKLETVVKTDDENAARRNFSKGQSKRMAMIFALLENRPILVLDEWAADQDPYFRKFFYEKLLPELKQQNKTIIAVTHDDAYFSAADRVIKFEHGKIIQDIMITKEKFDSEMLWES